MRLVGGLKNVCRYFLACTGGCDSIHGCDLAVGISLFAPSA